MSFPKINSLAQFVRKKDKKDIAQLQIASQHWMKAWAANHISYEIEWLGVPIIQSPEDMLLMQELIFKIRPDFIIETGVAHGGSLIYYASLFELLGHGQILGIDIDIRAHNRKVIEEHPMFKRISLIEGSSTSPDIVRQVSEKVVGSNNIIVCLDSNHTSDHVYDELKIYQQFIAHNGYIVVFDTITEFLASAGIAESRYINNGPTVAIDKFLSENSDFVRDAEYDKLWISASPGGYLKKIK